VGDEGKGKIVDVLTSKYDILLVFKEVQMQDIP
jgi:adenylosuccinate synthase